MRRMNVWTLAANFAASNISCNSARMMAPQQHPQQLHRAPHSVGVVGHGAGCMVVAATAKPPWGPTHQACGHKPASSSKSKSSNPQTSDKNSTLGNSCAGKPSSWLWPGLAATATGSCLGCNGPSGGARLGMGLGSGRALTKGKTRPIAPQCSHSTSKWPTIGNNGCVALCGGTSGSPMPAWATPGFGSAICPIGFLACGVCCLPMLFRNGRFGTGVCISHWAACMCGAPAGPNGHGCPKP